MNRRRRGVFSALSRRQWFICLFAFVWPLTTTAGKKKKSEIFAFSSNKFIVGGLFNARVNIAKLYLLLYIHDAFWLEGKQTVICKKGGIDLVDLANQNNQKVIG